MNKKISLTPSFGFIMWFCAFKSMSIVYKDECIADNDYYKDKKYFIETKLNILQHIMISLFTRIFILLIKKGFA